MSKATMSRDGQRRITMRIQYRVSGDDLVHTLTRMLDDAIPAGSTFRYTQDEIQKQVTRLAAKTTKTALLDAVRDLIAEMGHERLWTVSEGTYLPVEMLERVAAARVRDLFPELIVMFLTDEEGS